MGDETERLVVGDLDGLMLGHTDGNLEGVLLGVMDGDLDGVLLGQSVGFLVGPESLVLGLELNGC